MESRHTQKEGAQRFTAAGSNFESFYSCNPAKGKRRKEPKKEPCNE